MSHYLPSLAPPIAVTLVGVASSVSLVAGITSLSLFKGARVKRYASSIISISGYGIALFFLALWFSSGITFIEFYAPAIFNSPWAAAFAATVGVGLFFLRRNWLGMYGAVEIVGAAATLIICGFTAYGSTFQRASALLGAMYFLVRGMDNAEKGGLLSAIRRSLPKLGWREILAVVAMTVTVVAALIPDPDGDVMPPYMGSRDGTRLPVSAIECGNLFIVCDEAAWHEHERLVRGSPADRAQAESDAERRFSARRQR